MEVPIALQQQLAQVQALTPQSPETPQGVQQVLPDSSNPQMPETANMPGMEQVLPQAQQPTEFNQLNQPAQVQQPMLQQQQGIAQQPPQQMPQQDQQLNMMHGRLRTANDRIKHLENQVALSAAQPAPEHQQQVTPPAQITAAEVTDAQCIEHFGQVYFEEWGAPAVKQQLATMQNMMASMTPVASTQQPMQNTDQVQKLSNQVFQGELSRLVPNYMTIENNPQFDTWLNGNIDQMSGMYYNDWLDDAFREGDAKRAAHIFQMFLRQGSGTPVYNQHQPMQQQSIQPVYQPQQQYNNMQVNQPLQQAVMPNTAGAPTPQQVAAPTMSKEQCLATLADLPTKGLSPLQMSTEQARITAYMKTIQTAPHQQMQHAATGW